MNRIMGYASSIALVAMIGAVTTAHADDEARFGALRTKVAQLMAHEPDDVLTRIEKNWSTFTPCTHEPAAHLGGEIMAIDGVSYRFLFLPTSADGKYTCVYMDKPFRRALSVDEARDFSAALTMPDMPRSMPDFTTAAELAARASAGEKHLVELRALVASGTASPLDPEDRTIKHPDIGNLDNLTDCSHESIAELDARSNNSEHVTQALYNDIYYWSDVDPESARCVYMISPFKRGLTVAEAHDFLIALTLDLGMSDEFRRAHGLSAFPPRN